MQTIIRAVLRDLYTLIAAERSIQFKIYHSKELGDPMSIPPIILHSHQIIVHKESTRISKTIILSIGNN